MGAKGTTHTPAELRSPTGWPHTPEQVEQRRARMREYVRDKRANDPEYVERQRLYHQSEKGRAVRREASNRFKRARRDRLNAIKMATGCVDCGFAAHPAALQFDHVRGEKLFEIGSKTSMAWERMEAEIAKCDVVCANCHAIRTAERRTG